MDRSWAGIWIQNGWVLQAGVCVKPHVACAVCSVRRVHDAGHGRAKHMWGTLRNARFAFNAQGDVMAARVVGIRQEGLNPCRMVPSKRDEVREQLP